jgi:hypothetical protein
MKKLFFVLFSTIVFIGCNNNKTAEQKSEPAVASASDTKEIPPAEIADSKYIEIGKKGIAALSSGDIDGWMTSFADNAAYRWNSGDSLIGKPAITAYWKKRRGEVIDSITFTSDIWLPVKVNTSQQKVQTPGVWLLGWYMVNAKYKNGKRMIQWVHNDLHFDANDKIDNSIIYLDQAPIIQATKK